MAVVEKTSYTNFRTGETLPPKINATISTLGIPNVFTQQLPSNANLSCWGDSTLDEHNFLLTPYGNGWHLDRNKFDKFLIKSAVLKGCRLFSNSSLEAVDQSSTGEWRFSVQMDNTSFKVKSKFAIDASGRNSTFIKRAGGKRICHDHLIAITSVQTTTPSAPTSNFTLIEAVESGWWYYADLPENKVVFTYMTDADLYKQEANKNKNLFQNKLVETKYIKERLTNNNSSFVISSANTYIMDKLSGTNWLSIGDAAMAYDPLSSSGIYRAINEGMATATTVPDYLNGNKNALEDYGSSFKRRYDKYLLDKGFYYQLEKRWLHSEFWKRRQNKII